MKKIHTNFRRIIFITILTMIITACDTQSNSNANSGTSTVPSLSSKVRVNKTAVTMKEEPFMRAIYIDASGYFSPLNNPAGDNALNTSSKLIETAISQGSWTKFQELVNTTTAYNTAIVGFAPILANSINMNQMNKWLAWPNNDGILIGGTMETNLRKFLALNSDNQVLLSFGGGSQVGSWDSSNNPTDPKAFASSIINYIASTCTNGTNCLFNGIDLDLEGFFPFNSDPEASLNSMQIFLQTLRDEARNNGLDNFKIAIAPQPYYDPNLKKNFMVLPSNPQFRFNSQQFAVLDYILVQDYNLTWDSANYGPLCEKLKMAEMYKNNLQIINGSNPLPKLIMGKPAYSVTPCYETPTDFIQDVKTGKEAGVSGFFIWSMAFDVIHNNPTFMEKIQDTSF